MKPYFFTIKTTIVSIVVLLSLGINANNLAENLERAESLLSAGEYNKAYRKAAGLRDLAIYENKNRELATALFIIGRSFYYLGDYKSAIDYYLQTLSIYESMNDINKMSSILSSLGNLYHNLDEPDKALEYNQRAYDLLIDNNQSLTTKVMLNLGYALHKSNSYKAADDIFSQAHELAKLEENSIHLVYFYLMKTEMNRDRGDIENAIKNVDKAIKLSAEIQRKDLELAALLEKAQALHESHQFDEVISICTSLIDSANRLKRKDKLLKIYDTLYLTYKHLNQFQNALEFKEKYAELKASIDEFKTKQYFDILLVDRQLQESKNAISVNQEKLRSMQSSYEQSITNLKSFLYITIVIALALLVLTLITYKRKSRS